MQPIYTTKLKDDTLKWLCENTLPGHYFEFDPSILEEVLDVDTETITDVLGDFENMGIVSDVFAGRFGSFFNIKVKLRAYTLLEQGGFAVIDALNEANIQKIMLELESLQKQIKGKPDQLETFNKVTTILSSLTAVYAAFTAKS